ncbi:MAG: hypothetical protein ACFWTU_09320 [Leuconostoc mesenteroides]
MALKTSIILYFSLACVLKTVSFSFENLAVTIAEPADKTATINANQNQPVALSLPLPPVSTVKNATIGTTKAVVPLAPNDEPKRANVAKVPRSAVSVDNAGIIDQKAISLNE